MNDYRLTAMDVAALQKADLICIQYSAAKGATVRATKKHRPNDKDPFAPRETHIMLSSVEVCIRPTASLTLDLPQNASACELLYQYPEQHCPVWSVLQTLRKDDQITFEFYPDYHSNQYMARAGLHGDALLLHVSRGEGKARKAYTFKIASSNCPGNSARMVQNVPDPESRFGRLNRRC